MTNQIKQLYTVHAYTKIKCVTYLGFVLFRFSTWQKIKIDSDLFLWRISNQTWQKSLPVLKRPSKRKNGPDNTDDVTTGSRCKTLKALSMEIDPKFAAL